MYLLLLILFTIKVELNLLKDGRKRHQGQKVSCHKQVHKDTKQIHEKL